MSFTYRFTIILLLLSLLLNASKPDSSVYPADILRIKTRDTLIVAQFGGERPGFFAFDDKNQLPGKMHYLSDKRPLVGYDIELARRIADELKVTLKIDRNYKSFNSVAYAVARGEADIAISKLSVTTERSQFLSYTQPYLSLRIALLINRINESKIGVDKNNALSACLKKGALIGVLDNSSFVDHGEKLFPEAELKRYPDQPSLFDAVQNGEILAVLYEEYEIGKYTRKRPDLPIYCHKVELTGKSDAIAMAVAGKNTTLLGFLKTFMLKELTFPTVQQIIENYIPEDELKTSHRKTKSFLKNPGFFLAFAFTAATLILWMILAHRRSKAPKKAAKS